MLKEGILSVINGLERVLQLHVCFSPLLPVVLELLKIVKK